MIAEPYICTKGSDTGQIHWYTQVPAYGWIPYANFERRKLKELDNVKTAYCGFQGITISCKDCYWVLLSRKDCADNKCTFPWQTIKGDRAGEKQHCHHYGSADLIGYKPSDYDKDSESSRLLKRAEFLKAVCEKEGIPWLPQCEHNTVRAGGCPICKPEESKQDEYITQLECGIHDIERNLSCLKDANPTIVGDLSCAQNLVDACKRAISVCRKTGGAKQEPKEGFWKGNKRREGTEHLTYTTKDEDFLSNPFAKDKVNHCEKCDAYMNVPLEAHACRQEEPKPECKHKWIGCQQGWETSLWCSECGAEPKEPENRTTTSASTYKDTHEMSTMYLHSHERDYYTKEEEKEFRSDLLHLLEWETKHSPKKRNYYRGKVIESLRKKYL